MKKTSGSAPDWTFGQEGIIYSYTCELRGNSFILPPSDVSFLLLFILKFLFI